MVVSDVEHQTDTTECADVLLPAAAWGEKDGTVTNTERRVSRQRAFLPLPGEARPDWRIICDVADAMGFGEAFRYPGPSDIFSEHASLSAAGNDGSRDFDIGGLSRMDRITYDRLLPVQWPVAEVAATAGGRFFADGQFYTLDRRARFVPTPARASRLEAVAGRLTLNTGRIRDQWHTMTRTGRSSRLSGHLAEPFVAINPSDAARLGIGRAELVRVSSCLGSATVRALITDTQPAGSVFAPMHWTRQGAKAARIDVLISAVTDPLSGQPALKAAPVDVTPYRPTWQGFGVTLRRPVTDDLTYWAVARTNRGYRFECAGKYALSDTSAATRLLDVSAADGYEILQYMDCAGGALRTAVFDGDTLVAAFIAGRLPVSVERTWLISLLGETITDSRQRAMLLAGRPDDPGAGPGALICSCNGVGVNTIRAAITDGACSVRAVGQQTEAGTGCGSCQSEIRRMLDDVPITEAV